MFKCIKKYPGDSILKCQLKNCSESQVGLASGQCFLHSGRRCPTWGYASQASWLHYVSQDNLDSNQSGTCDLAAFNNKASQSYHLQSFPTAVAGGFEPFDLEPVHPRMLGTMLGQITLDHMVEVDGISLRKGKLHGGPSQFTNHVPDMVDPFRTISSKLPNLQWILVNLNCQQ